MASPQRAGSSPLRRAARWTPECRGRIDMIRDWLPPGRRAALDSAVPSATPAVGRRAGQLLKTIVSMCDGSGAAALLATREAWDGTLDRRGADEAFRRG